MKKSLSKWPNYSLQERKAVSKVLSSNIVNYLNGNQGRLFEKEFSKFSNSKFSIAVANGSVALDLVLKALNIGSGDEVIVTSRSYMSSASCVVNAGAKPIFSDVDLISGNLSPETISTKITKKTKAIICVHLAGWPCEMNSILKIAKKFKLFVIEDCAQAHGAKINKRSVGSFGDFGTWSFCQDKIITTGGEGGMITTNNKNLWNKIWSLKDHGKSYNSYYEKEHSFGFKWHHENFGSNYRLTEIQSSIGRIQLKKIKNWTKKRNENALEIIKTLKKFPKIIFVPEPSKKYTHAYYRLYAYLKINGLAKNWTRNKIIKELNAEQIPCFSGSCPEIYLEEAFIKNNLSPKKRLPNAKILGETSLCFLVHPTIIKKDMNFLINNLNAVLTKASR